ncbi:MAG: hypothetical protein MPW15_26525 [Candidatus Manganitrophus sp.]|nr:hypothetical protein [Candidatus Manganitrophus sp.]
MGGGVDREADGVGILLNRGGDDFGGGVVQTEVDHLVPAVAQGARDDFDPAVVAVEADLGEQHPLSPFDRLLSIG